MNTYTLFFKNIENHRYIDRYIPFVFPSNVFDSSMHEGTIGTTIDVLGLCSY